MNPKIARIFAHASVLAALVAAPAALATPYSLTINATVLSASNCKFTTGAGSVLAFGAIDPSSLTAKTASVSLQMKCAGSANTAAYSLSSNDGLYPIGAGLPRMRHTVTVTEFLPYMLNTPIAGTTPKNVITTLTITGTIAVADFQNAAAGNFSDTQVLTLAP
jgi:hypothetical protein